MDASNPHRLSREVLPVAYRLAIDTEVAEGRFSGTVTIEAEAMVTTDRIVCNIADLTITGAAVRVGTSSLTPTIDIDPATERLILHLAEPLAPGPLTIDVTFNGVLNDRLVGFYRSSFTVDDRTDYMAVTQFEAPYARRAFPCWDEPAFKATFDISLTCDAGLIAVSNGPELKRTTLADGRIRFDFDTTMVMSTYLVAWVIGELEVSDTVRGGTTDIGVVHRPGKSHLTAFALECAAHAVAWFEDYYGIDHPGAKLDLAAIPDFAFGAMENLGCVTFRENLLLIDPQRSNRSELERAATVIEHEIAHMWFGDLVTMQWWNGIWLNEAFATFMEFCCADSFRPEWDIWTSFSLSKSQAFETDALATTRPIEFEVVTPADAEAMFDILTYEKGASVLRMFEHWTGADKFRDGVRQYLSRHAYGNTDTPDLWERLTEATGVDVGTMMNTWILQGGHPLVSATATATGVRLSQQRFEFAGGGPTQAASWIIPIRMEAEVGGVQVLKTVLLDSAATEIDLGGPVEWVNVNSGFTGFYRCEYEPALHARLLARAADLDAVDRYAVLDDAWSLLLAGRIELEELVATLRAIGAVETQASVWRRIGGVLSSLSSLCHPADQPAIAGLTRELVEPHLAEAAGATASDRDLGAVLFRLAGSLGALDSVITEARRLHGGMPESVAGNPDLEAAVLEVIAANGDAADFDAMVALFRTATTPQDELRALAALAQFPDHDLTAQLCEMCATEVRTQNAPFVLAQAMANPVCGPDVWRFVASRWDELIERFPSSSVIRMAGGIRAFAEAELAGEITTFFATHGIPQATLTLNQHLERLAVNVEARKRLGRGIAERIR